MVNLRGHNLRIPQNLPWHVHGSRNKITYDFGVSFWKSKPPEKLFIHKIS